MFLKKLQVYCELHQLEENEKLQIDRYGYEMFEVRTSDCLGCGSLDDTDGDGLPHVPDGEPTKRREV